MPRIVPLVYVTLTTAVACTANTYGVSNGAQSATSTGASDSATLATASTATSEMSNSPPTTGIVPTGTTGAPEPACGDPGPGDPGSLIRLVKFDGPGTQVLHGVTMDPDGYIYVVGEYDTELQVDDKTEVQSASHVPFVYKFCPNGELVWGKHGESQGSDPVIYEPYLNRFAIAADSTGAYITGQLLRDVTFPGNPGKSDIYLVEPTNARSAFVAHFDSATGQPTKGVTLNAWAQIGMDITADGDEIYVTGRCASLDTPNTTGLLLVKLDSELNEYPGGFRCIGGGVGNTLHRTVGRSISLPENSSFIVVGGTLIEPTVAAEEFGPCNKNLTTKNRNGFVAAITRDSEKWASPALWNWCHVFATDAVDDILLDTAMSSQSLLAALATRGAEPTDALNGCGLVTPEGALPEEVFALATLDAADGECKSAEWFQGQWVVNFPYSIAVSASGGSIFLTGHWRDSLPFRNTVFDTKLFMSFLGAKISINPDEAVEWHVQATHPFEVQDPLKAGVRSSRGTHVAVSEQVVAFIGDAQGDVALSVGTESRAVGSEYETLSTSPFKYDSFLLLVRP